MAFKINIGTKEGKTFKLELESEELVGKELHDKIEGKSILPDLAGYEFEITGASDKSGFTVMANVEGIGLKKELLTYGKGFKKRPRKEGKRKLTKNRPKGLRMRKTVRGKVISPEISQINLKVIKEGDKKIGQVFSDQNKAAEPEVPKEEKQVGEDKKGVGGRGVAEGKDATPKITETIEQPKVEEKTPETPKEEANPEAQPKEVQKSEEEKPTEETA